ncbi:MAG: TetR/AcrR family transcriptional regulator [Coriobacteriales bacterium]|nr:TetR/AcrR family transcriptional regulator [Coriobacteriales bacterium]
MNVKPIERSEYETRMRIVDSFEELLEHSTFGHVSVDELCKKSGVSKSVFYRLFEGKRSVATWTFDFFAMEYSKALGVSMDWRDSHRHVLQVMIKYHALFSSAMNEKGIDSFYQLEIRKLTANLEAALFDYHGVSRSDELVFQISFISHATVLMVCDWFVAGMPYDMETLLDYLEAVVPQKLYNTVNRLMSANKQNRSYV